MEEQALSIKDIFKILRKRIKIIILITLITTITSIIVTYFLIEPTYLTKSKLFIGMPTMNEEGEENQSWDFSYYKQLLEPCSEIIKSDDLIERAIERGNLNVSQSTLSNSLNVQLGNGQVLELAINTKDPLQGVEILNAIIDEFIETSNKLIKNSNVTIISSPKVPTAPITPNKPKNIVFGIGLGLALGIAIAIIIEYMDNSVKDEEEAERIMGIPMLGIVPEYYKKTNTKETKKNKKTKETKKIRRRRKNNA